LIGIDPSIIDLNYRFAHQCKIHMLASGFFKDFSNIGLAYGFVSQNLGFLFAILKHLTDLWLADFFSSYRGFVCFESISYLERS
jgi:hypothetical protein